MIELILMRLALLLMMRKGHVHGFSYIQPCLMPLLQIFVWKQLSTLIRRGRISFNPISGVCFIVRSWGKVETILLFIRLMLSSFMSKGHVHGFSPVQPCQVLFRSHPARSKVAKCGKVMGLLLIYWLYTRQESYYGKIMPSHDPVCVAHRSGCFWQPPI